MTKRRLDCLSEISLGKGIEGKKKAVQSLEMQDVYLRRWGDRNLYRGAIFNCDEDGFNFGLSNINESSWRNMRYNLVTGIWKVD
ncbi:MAG: hypothetical protein ACOCUU_03335 [Nanoarchaeota archaeon]